MNKNILNPEVQTFINTGLSQNISEIALKGCPFGNISTQELANQIVSKGKSEHKLPSWFTAKNIYYPPKINIEQTSSEVTANYKASLISGENIIDITGGFGVDCYAFSKNFKKVVHCELNTDLSVIVNHNYKQLKINNITTIAGNGLEYLKKTKEHFDCIYIDPSRRHDIKGKVFLLKDCLPNVPENLDFLFTKTNRILIKNSPILDISSTINELNFVKEIHIVAVANEVKELLFLLEKDYVGTIQLKTINLSKHSNQVFNFLLETKPVVTYSLPLSFLYEPNAAILKSGGFNEVANTFKIAKLHQHSHLYTSEENIDFPGRKFTIEHCIPFDKKQLKKLIPEGKANITTRNFPISVADIRKKTKLKDGGTWYLFFTTNLENKRIVLITKKAS